MSSSRHTRKQRQRQATKTLKNEMETIAKDEYKKISAIISPWFEEHEIETFPGFNSESFEKLFYQWLVDQIDIFKAQDANFLKKLKAQMIFMQEANEKVALNMINVSSKIQFECDIDFLHSYVNCISSVISNLETFDREIIFHQPFLASQLLDKTVQYIKNDILTKNGVYKGSSINSIIYIELREIIDLYYLTFLLSTLQGHSITLSNELADFLGAKPRLLDPIIGLMKDVDTLNKPISNERKHRFWKSFLTSLSLNEISLLKENRLGQFIEALIETNQFIHALQMLSAWETKGEQKKKNYLMAAWCCHQSGLTEQETEIKKQFARLFPFKDTPEEQITAEYISLEFKQSLIEVQANYIEERKFALQHKKLHPPQIHPKKPENKIKHKQSMEETSAAPVTTTFFKPIIEPIDIDFINKSKKSEHDVDTELKTISTSKPALRPKQKRDNTRKKNEQLLAARKETEIVIQTKINNELELYRQRTQEQEATAPAVFPASHPLSFFATNLRWKKLDSQYEQKISREDILTNIYKAFDYLPAELPAKYKAFISGNAVISYFKGIDYKEDEEADLFLYADENARGKFEIAMTQADFIGPLEIETSAGIGYYYSKHVDKRKIECFIQYVNPISIEDPKRLNELLLKKTNGGGYTACNALIPKDREHNVDYLEYSGFAKRDIACNRLQMCENLRSLDKVLKYFDSDPLNFLRGYKYIQLKGLNVVDDENRYLHQAMRQWISEFSQKKANGLPCSDEKNLILFNYLLKIYNRIYKNNVHAAEGEIIQDLNGDLSLCNIFESMFNIKLDSSQIFCRQTSVLGRLSI